MSFQTQIVSAATLSSKLSQKFFWPKSHVWPYTENEKYTYFKFDSKYWKYVTEDEPLCQILPKLAKK